MEARMPKMLSANQIEAHVTRLTAVREGLRKYEGDDARAKDAGEAIEVVIFTLQQDVPVPQKAAEDVAAPEEVVETVSSLVLEDEAREAAMIGEEVELSSGDDTPIPEEAEPINHSDPSNLPPPTPIRPLEDKPASEVEEADPSEATDQTPRW